MKFMSGVTQLATLCKALLTRLLHTNQECTLASILLELYRKTRSLGMRLGIGAYMYNLYTCTMSCTVGGIKTVTFPFRSVPSKRNASSAVCRFITCTPPVYFRSVSVSVPFRMRECGSTPRPCPLIARCKKKILVESQTF